MKMRRFLTGAMLATVLALAVPPAWISAQQRGQLSLADARPGRDPNPSLLPLESGLGVAPDPCLDCSAIYAGSCGTGLWRIDPVAGTSTLVGAMPANMFDIAITSDRRLFGITGLGDLYEISACDASGVFVRNIPSFINGLAGDIHSTDLFAQGPPLLRIATTGSFPVTTVGGGIGPAPPDWCGGSSGDLVMNPMDGLLYSALGCWSCGGDALVAIDPGNGDALSEVGCIVSPVGGALGGIYGLAFDSVGTLWGGAGGTRYAAVYEIDPATAIATPMPISGGYDCTYGLAACPMPLQPSAPCPHSQGFWKNHPGEWPASSLTLGNETYSQAEALALLRTPVRGDASLILAKQLIAAKLNIMTGSDRVPVNGYIVDADNLFATYPGKLPYDVHPSTTDGHTMTTLGGVLDEYNNQLLTPDCTERATLPMRATSEGGGCSGVIGAPMPPADILGTMLPMLALALGLVALRMVRRLRPALARQKVLT